VKLCFVVDNLGDNSVRTYHFSLKIKIKLPPTSFLKHQWCSYIYIFLVLYQCLLCYGYTAMNDNQAQPDSSHSYFKGVMECQFSTLTQTNMIRKDPIFKTLMLSRKGQTHSSIFVLKTLYNKTSNIRRC